MLLIRGANFSILYHGDSASNKEVYSLAFCGAGCGAEVALVHDRVLPPNQIYDL